MTGPSSLGGTDAWSVWTDRPELLGQIAGWLTWYSVFDLVFLVGYVGLLVGLVSGRRLATVALAGLVVVELLEALLILVAAQQVAGGSVPEALRWSVAVVALVKWLVVAVLVVVLVCDRAQRASFGRAVRRGVRALNYQRLSLVVVAVLALLCLVPLPNIWDQLPDVQRGWFDSATQRGLRHLVAAAVLSVLVSCLLFVLGRQRSERAWFDAHPSLQAGHAVPSKDGPSYGWWAVGPALAVGLSLLLAGPLGRPELVDWQVVGIFVGLPAMMVLASLGLRALKGRHPSWPVWDRPRLLGTPEQRRQRAYDTWSAGDVLAFSVVVLSTLSLVRSLTAPVLLGGGDDQVRWVARIVVLLVVGVGVSLAVFPLAALLLRRLDGQGSPEDPRGLRRLLRPTEEGRSDGLFSAAAPVLIWAVAVIGLASLMLFPLWLGEELGVVATTLMAFGCWAVALGFFIVHLQHREPLQVFALLRLRSNPVLSLLILTPLLGSLLPQDADLHALRQPDVPAALPDRPSLQSAFETWLDDSAACDRLVGATTVRPLVLVAASGGGIRAAAWTSGVLDRLGRGGPCAASATFLSSGVSGGSVGLALSRGRDPMAAVARLAEPEALTAGITGTVVGDLVAGTAGVRLPSRVGGKWDWRDRAALIESAWERAAPALAAGYDASLAGPGGYLILNSTAAGSGCKVLVSQVRLDVEPAGEQDGPPVDEAVAPVTPRCGALSGQPPASLDLQRTYGRCTPDMSWGTASMLSARFPTVTPGGRVPPELRRTPAGDLDCRQARPLQLIDGGYAESSGVGTLADIAPALQQVVRRHNAGVGAAGPVVVPVVLYLEDETRKDIARGPEDLSPELFVPVVGRGAKGVQTSTATWLQRVSDAYADPCPALQDSACRDAVEQVRKGIGGGVVVAAPLTRPSVEAPLGWTLSQDSRSQLERGLEEQAAGCEVETGRYTCLRTLLDLVGAQPPA